MSIKIYNGLKISDTNLFLIELQALKSKLIKEYSNENLRLAFLEWCFYKKNTKTTFDTEVEISDYAKFNKDFISNKKSYELGYSNDYDLSISYFPNQSLAIPYCENKNLISKLLEFESVTEYQYWNNTDKPESISEKSWNTREIKWSKALKSRHNNRYDEAIELEIFTESLDPSIIFNSNDIINQALENYISKSSFDQMIPLYGTDAQKEMYSKIISSDDGMENVMAVYNISKALYAEHGDDYIKNWFKHYHTHCSKINN